MAVETIPFDTDAARETPPLLLKPSQMPKVNFFDEGKVANIGSIIALKATNRDFLIATIFGMSIAVTQSCLAGPQVIMEDSEPLALVGIEEPMNRDDGCSTHLGSFVVVDVVYEGASEIVGGIRVLPIDETTSRLHGNSVPMLMRFEFLELSNVEMSWVPTLVQEGRELLIAYNVCGNGGYHTPREIFRLDRLSW